MGIFTLGHTHINTREHKHKQTALSKTVGKQILNSVKVEFIKFDVVVRKYDSHFTPYSKTSQLSSANFRVTNAQLDDDGAARHCVFGG